MTENVSQWRPWYRREGYTGDLTEKEKRHLDHFYFKAQHPAVDVDMLPMEAQRYIDELEGEIYDAKQQFVAAKVVVLTIVIMFLIFAKYFEIAAGDLPSTLIIGCILLGFGWLNYHREFRKNADAYNLPKKIGSQQVFATDEMLRRNWDICEVCRIRNK